MGGRVDWLTSKRVVCSVENNTIYSPLHYFPSVSDRWFGEGVRLLLTRNTRMARSLKATQSS